MVEKTFYQHFKYSLNCLGLPAPNSLFTGITTAVGTIKTLCEAVEKFGTKVTFREVMLTVPAGYFSTSFAVEALGVLGTITVSYYAGACIGALIYATEQYVSGKTFSNEDLRPDLFDKCFRHGIKVPKKLQRHMLYEEFAINLRMQSTNALA